MLCAQNNHIRLSKADTHIARQLCHLSKNMFNVGLYAVRQYFFQEGRYLRYEGLYHEVKDNENYRLLATDVAQQTLKVVDRSFRSFFNLLKAKELGKVTVPVHLPRYLDKDGFFMLVIPIRSHHDFAKDDWRFTVPTSRTFRREHGTITVDIPERLREKSIKEIRILPRYGGRIFEASYIYEAGHHALLHESEHALGIDLGLDNLAACVSTTDESFLIDGRWLKSANQWYNKRIAELRSMKDKQGLKGLTNQEAHILYKRANRVKDALAKAARYIVNFCIERNITTIVVGYNPTLKQGVNMGHRNNQSFTNIPIFTLRRKLKSLCDRCGLLCLEQEESYTSKASFLDDDPVPVYNADNPQEYAFSGTRTKRGLYRSKNGIFVNADANGAANILRKSKHNVLLENRVSRGCLAHPKRITL